MNIDYNNYKNAENEIYKGIDKISVPTIDSINDDILKEGFDWLCENTNSVLDFGCGSGSMLFRCALRGANELEGIDYSEEGIKICQKRSELMKNGQYKFTCGTVNELKLIDDNHFDAAILSNVIDNMTPADSVEAIKQIKRIVRDNGKILIKLNPYLTADKISEWKIQIIEGNLLDDGLLLWNQTTDEWRELLTQYFTEARFIDVYYEDYDQHNRMFLLTNK